MREALDAAKFDLILIDYNLDEEIDLSALEHIQDHPENGEAATTMTAGEGQAEIAVTALKNGCSDYIVTENFNPELLHFAIINALQKSHLVKSFNAEAELRSVFETVLNVLKRECIQEMRPMLPRMLLKRAKTSRVAPPAVMAARTYSWRQLKTCLRLFSFLDDIERFQPEATKLNSNQSWENFLTGPGCMLMPPADFGPPPGRRIFQCRLAGRKSASNSPSRFLAPPLKTKN